MAQVLKDDLRESILRNASEEFLQQGFEKASMRRIAQNSSMTVGNLYRYFKSKDELSDTIVSPTNSAIDILVKKVSKGKIGLGMSGSDFSASVAELKTMLSEVSDGLVDIYAKHRTELRILMMGSKLNKELTGWFTALIAELISMHFPFGKDDPRVLTMAKCYSEAIFTGIRTLFEDESIEVESLKNMVRVYLNSYIMMLDQSFASLY